MENLMVQNQKSALLHLRGRIPDNGTVPPWSLLRHPQLASVVDRQNYCKMVIEISNVRCVGGVTVYFLRDNERYAAEYVVQLIIKTSAHNAADALADATHSDPKENTQNPSATFMFCIDAEPKMWMLAGHIRGVFHVVPGVTGTVHQHFFKLLPLGAGCVRLPTVKVCALGFSVVRSCARMFTTQF